MRNSVETWRRQKKTRGQAESDTELQVTLLGSGRLLFHECVKPAVIQKSSDSGDSHVPCRSATSTRVLRCDERLRRATFADQE